MSAIPSLTILSEEQKFNGDNLLQWKNNITQLLGAKGLMGYIDGKIQKPAQSSTSESDKVTPIYSTTPMLDEWNFRDQLTRGHITFNCTDVASLGVVTTGTAMDAWNSIKNEWGKSTDMRRSHAQESLNRTEYTEGTEIQDHIKLLRTRKAAVDNLSTFPMSDETWRGIIIRSIPPTSKWLPVIPSLYSMAASADIVSTLFAHGMILGRGTTNSYSTALATQTNEGCKNPNCKAKDRSTHTTENCYWLGGGKEGQFPANFGQRSKVNITTVSSPQTEHFALSAGIPRTQGKSGILIDNETYTYHTPIKLASANQPGNTDITNHINHELNIITDISDAPSPAPRSTSHCTSASVGEQLSTPLTVVTELEPIIINHHIIRHHTNHHIIRHHHIIRIQIKQLNDDQLTTLVISSEFPVDHHDFDHHDQVINDIADITTDHQQNVPVIPAKSIPQSYKHTIELTDGIFDGTSSTDEEIGQARNESGGVWETKDVGEIRSSLGLGIQVQPPQVPVTHADQKRPTTSDATNSESRVTGKKDSCLPSNNNNNPKVLPSIAGINNLNDNDNSGLNPRPPLPISSESSPPTQSLSISLPSESPTPDISNIQTSSIIIAIYLPTSPGPTHFTSHFTLLSPPIESKTLVTPVLAPEVSPTITTDTKASTTTGTKSGTDFATIALPTSMSSSIYKASPSWQPNLPSDQMRMVSNGVREKGRWSRWTIIPVLRRSSSIMQGTT